MRLVESVYFTIGILTGVMAMVVANHVANENFVGRERLTTYRLYLEHYSDRESCLAISDAVHRSNEELLSVMKLVGPESVSTLAEELYLNCSNVRADARNANVPTDWFSRTGHSWTRFDRTRTQLVDQMVFGLPEDLRRTFRADGGPNRNRAAPATTRSR